MNEEILSLIKELNRIAADLVKPKVDFNVLTALHIEHREVYMCRLIGGLLAYSPVIRKHFGQIVFPDEIDDFENSTIVLEEIIDEKRRVDIAIKTNTRIYPIEAKIYADDQDSQLYDYWKYYTETDTKRFTNGKIYYLTPGYRCPSEKSRGQLTVGKEIVLISFTNQIAKWLAAVEKDSLCQDVKYVVQEFQEVIEKMCQSEDILKTLFPDGNFDNIHGVGILLKNHSEILRKVKEIYIRKCFENSVNEKKFEIEPMDDSSDPKALFYVLRNKERIAKLCVDTNLYIYLLGGHKATASAKWDAKEWAYIYRDEKSPKLNLKEFWNLIPPIKEKDTFVNLQKLLLSID